MSDKGSKNRRPAPPGGPLRPRQESFHPITIYVAYLGGELFSLKFAAPSPVHGNSYHNEDDRNNDATERDDDFDPLVEWRLVMYHNTVRHVSRYHVLSRCLELEKTVYGTGCTARGHSQYVPRGRTNAHSVHSLHTYFPPSLLSSSIKLGTTALYLVSMYVCVTAL